MKKNKGLKKNNLEIVCEVFIDVGVVSWLCLIFGCLIFLTASWNEHKLHLIFGLIAILYSVGRFHQVADKRDIIEEVRKAKKT